MSIKIALLKSGESVITDVKELIRDDQIHGYLFKKPYAVNLSPAYGFLTEDASGEDDGNVSVSFSPWIPFTTDEEILVRCDWLVTVVNPAKEIQELYEEMINGQSDQSNSAD